MHEAGRLEVTGSDVMNSRMAQSVYRFRFMTASKAAKEFKKKAEHRAEYVPFRARFFEDVREIFCIDMVDSTIAGVAKANPSYPKSVGTQYSTYRAEGKVPEDQGKRFVLSARP